MRFARRALALAAFLVARAASARDIAYEAPAECPSREEAVRTLEARAPEGRAATLSVRRHGDGYRGEVVLGDGEDRAARSVEARSCRAVVDALALIVALDAPEPDVAASTEARRAELPEAPAPREAPPAPKAPDPRPLRIGVGATIGTAGFVEDPAWQGKLFADVTAPGLFGGLPALAPSARLAVSRAAGATITRGTTKAEFALWSAGLDACPLGVLGLLDGASSLELCARIEIGRVEAASVLEASRPFFAAGGALRHRFVFGSGGASPFLDLDLAATTPLVRDRFLLPGEAAIEPRLVAFSAGIGGGVVFR